jgi:membrane protein required for colicin V production
VTTLDAAGIAFVALAAGAGALSGALRPLFLAAGAGLGWLAASHLSEPLGRLLERVLPAPASRAVAAAVLFVATVLLAGALGRVLGRRAIGERRPGDRAAGALLGGAAAGLAAWMALSVLEASRPLLPRSLRRELARSDLASMVREHDLPGPWRRPAEEALRRLLRLAADPQGAARIARDPDLSGLAGDQRLRELLDKTGQGQSDMEESARTLRLLADPDFRARLERAQEKLLDQE